MGKMIMSKAQPTYLSGDGYDWRPVLDDEAEVQVHLCENNRDGANAATNVDHH